MAEEATLRVALHPEDIPLAVREGGEPIRRPARVPGIRSWPPMAVDEPKYNLVILGEIRQDLRLTLLGEQQFSFRVGRDERHDSTALQRPREGAGPGVFEPKVTRSALVVPGVV